MMREPSPPPPREEPPELSLWAKAWLLALALATVACMIFAALLDKAAAQPAIV